MLTNMKIKSYILANIESVAPPTPISTSMGTQSLIPVTVHSSGSQATNPNQIPVHTLATEVPVELVQVQEPVMYYSDWFNTAVPVTVQPSNQNIQIIQPNQIQILQFEPASIPNVRQVTELEDELLLSKPEQKQDGKNCSVRVAKKSLPGVVPSKDELEGELNDETLTCFICGPEEKFQSTDDLQLHCNLHHEMTSYVDSIKGTGLLTFF